MRKTLGSVKRKKPRLSGQSGIIPVHPFDWVAVALKKLGNINTPGKSARKNHFCIPRIVIQRFHNGSVQSGWSNVPLQGAQRLCCARAGASV